MRKLLMDSRYKRRLPATERSLHQYPGYAETDAVPLQRADLFTDAAGHLDAEHLGLPLLFDHSSFDFESEFLVCPL